MKIIKLIIGCFCIVVFGIGVLVAVLNLSMTQNIPLNTETIGASGVMVLIFNIMLTIAGILSIFARRNKFGDIITGAFYILAAFLGLAVSIIYIEVVIWTIPISVWLVVTALFGSVFVYSHIENLKTTARAV